MQPAVTVRRLMPILLGILVALAAFALLFAGVAYFAPRFLRAAGNGQIRFILIIAMGVLVILNAVGRMRRRKARREQNQRAANRSKPLDLTSPPSNSH